jgi:hypothetical protein
MFWVRKCYVRRGNGKYCSTSCGTQFRNKHSNPAKRQEVRDKISKNHADVSGKNNPMYGQSGKAAPGYIDGRNSFSGNIWRRIALANKDISTCEECGKPIVSLSDLHVHHKDFDRSNNAIENLEIVHCKCHNNILHPPERDESGRFISGKRGR